MTTAAPPKITTTRRWRADAAAAFDARERAYRLYRKRGDAPALLPRSPQARRDLFGDRVGSLEMTRKEYVERAASPRDYVELFKATFGPAAAIYASLAGQPELAAALDGAFLESATRSNRGAPEGPADYHYEYLPVVARSRVG